MPTAVAALRRTQMSLPSDDCSISRQTMISGLPLLDPQPPRAFSKHPSTSKTHQSETWLRNIPVKMAETYPRVGKDHFPADCFLNGLHFVFSKSVMLTPPGRNISRLRPGNDKPGPLADPQGPQ